MKARERFEHYWAPLLLRLFIGYSLFFGGLIKLGELNFNHVALLASIDMPSPEVVASLLALLEFVSGLAILVGAFTTTMGLIGSVVVAGPAILAMLNGNFPVPFAEIGALPDFAVHQYGETLVMVGALLALAIGGAGRFSIDYVRVMLNARNKPLSLIAKVKDGHAEALEKILREINANQQANPYINFKDDNVTHFMRMFIVTTEDEGTRLFYTATHYGDRDEYVERLMELWPGLDEVWQHCEGYKGRKSFPRFVKQHFVQSPYWFTAFPHETVESLRNKIAIREELERFLDLPDVNRYMDQRGLQPFIDRLNKVSDPSSLVLLDRYLRRTSLFIKRSLQKGFVWLALRATKIYAQFGEPKEFPRYDDDMVSVEEQKRYMAHIDALEANESPFIQNELTLVVPIRQDRLFRLRMALFFGGYLAGFGYPPGELTGVYTIHFLHWLIIDDGKRGLVFSNYDGTWENYLGDFADKLNHGLDALFNNCEGYPPGGLQRIESWAKWVRSAHVVVPLYYSAYPKNTAIHIARDREIAALIGRDFNEQNVHDVLYRLQ